MDQFGITLADAVHEQVFELLLQAAMDRDPVQNEIRLDRAMTSLRNNPRWHEILKMMGLAVW